VALNLAGLAVALAVALAAGVLCAATASADGDPAAPAVGVAVPRGHVLCVYRQVADIDEPASACAPAAASVACPSLGFPDPLIGIPCLDSALDSHAEAKKHKVRPVTFGADIWQWWNVQNRSGYPITYGYPGAEGTYYYALTGNVEWKVEEGKRFGFHAEGRARDQTKFAPYYDSKVWLYEGYAWMHVGVGAMKAGSIWKRFGVDGDGTWWGNVPYYDGIKYDPDWGFSWERVHAQDPDSPSAFYLDTYAQFFVKDDGKNGSAPGADAESAPALHEKNTFVARVVPTWHLDAHTTVAVGLSGLTGTIRHDRGAGRDERIDQGALDATISWCGLKAFGECIVGEGAQNPQHYVTGGPSDAFRDVAAGIEWKLGGITPRVAWSRGEYRHPGGHQTVFDVGLQIELTKFLELYLEYVRWDQQADGGPKVVAEDGFEIVLHWHV
jgi:hypothetical protein